MPKKSSPPITFFDPTLVRLEEITKRLVVSGPRLPPNWIPGQLPRPPLPIDHFVKNLREKRRVRDLKELEQLHRLGQCPYAVVRSGISHAVRYATVQQAKEEIVKPLAVEALKYLKDEAPRLRSELVAAEARARVLVEVGLEVHGEPLLPGSHKLAETLLISHHLLEKNEQAIGKLHREMSQHAGNVWRRSFVTALFRPWWLLTNRDPKPSPGPCQEFISSAWCSLSPLASAADADWASAIKVALSRCEPGGWRSDLADAIDET